MVQAAVHLSEYWAAARSQVEEALDLATREIPGAPPRLIEAIRYSLLGGGKRLRALLVLLAHEGCGGTRQQAMPAACALEMVHAYSLIHDDLPAMDDDDLRRGQPTNHKVFGEAMAILAGDGLLTLAFEVIAREVKPAELAAECTLQLAQAAGASGMVGGQADDLAGNALTAGRSLLESIHRRKTGALIRASLELGGIMAGADDQRREALRRYGDALGLAFQITDDLLDVQGEESVVGKRVGKDAQHGKLTFPAVLGIDESRRQADRAVEQAVAAVASWGGDADRLVELARFIKERDR